MMTAFRNPPPLTPALPLTPEAERTIREMRSNPVQGWRAIGKALGISATLASEWGSRLGLDTTIQPKRSGIEDNELARLWADRSWTVARIAKHFGTAKSSITDRVAKAGLPPRPARGSAAHPLLAEITRLWANHTAEEIAAELATTGGVVMGVVRRAGLSVTKPYSVTHKARTAKPKVTKPKIARASRQPKPRVPVIRVPKPKPVRIIGAPLPTGPAVTHSDGCLFPMWGHKERPPQPNLWCGEPRLRGSWCAHHLNVVFYHAE